MNSILDAHKDDIIHILRQCGWKNSAAVKKLLEDHKISTTDSSLWRARKRWEVGPEDYEYDPLTPLTAHVIDTELPDILKKVRSREALMELWERTQEMQEVVHKLDTVQSSVNVELKDNKPIGLCFAADFHLGHRGTRYDWVLEGIQQIVDTPGAYISLNGDIIDNSIIHKGSHFEELLVPKLQKLLVEGIMERIYNICFYALQGTHEEWSHSVDNFDFGEHMADHSIGAYLGMGGDIYVDVAGAKYHIHARHQYKYESSLNVINAFRQMWDNVCPFDIGVISHTHNPPMIWWGYRHQGEHRKSVIYVRPGTAKVYDRWAGQRAGAFGAEFSIPMVILMPEEKSIIPFRDLGVGLRTLELYRENW